MRTLWPVLLLLTGCAAVAQPPARYDLGPAARGPSAALALAAISVRSPSWLSTPAMQYRLDYASGARRRAYGDSRWAAAPAELVALTLERRLLTDGPTAAGCRLALDLDEFVQDFDGPASSRATLEARATLLALRGDGPVARQGFSLRQRAGADATSGVAAFAVATARLGSELAAWLDRIALERPDIALRCREPMALSQPPLAFEPLANIPTDKIENPRAPAESVVAIE